MCTCTVTGTTWREPECSGTGPWRGTTYSVAQVVAAETDYSLRPDEIVPPDEVTLTVEPRRTRENAMSISEGTDESFAFTELV